MELEPYDAGWISLIPPIFAIILAFVTKEVIFSLFLASLLGSIIYECYAGGSIITVFTNLTNMICLKSSDEVSLLVFILLMGSLVEVMKKSGSTKAYSVWISRIIKSKFAAQFCTFLLGFFLFVDDYFNCLSNGTVMKPVADITGISNFKISYLIKGMAINCALIIPISSWGATVTTQISLAGIESPVSVFLNSIPFISLPLLFFIFVLILMIFNYDFGRMAAEEKYAEEHKHSMDTSKIPMEILTPTRYRDSKCKSLYKPHVIDLIFPILFLIVISLLLMLWSGGFFEGESIGLAFGNAETTLCLATATLLTVILCFIIFIPRHLMPFLTFMDAVKDGIADMMSTVLLLIMAWTLAGYSNDLLGTGNFIAKFMIESNLPSWILPLIVYLFSCILSFALGNAWVTFSIFIPIAGKIVSNVDQRLVYATIAACLSGSSFGELASPISDTTILTAAATGVNTAEFTSACFEYNMLLGGLSALSYLIYGIDSGSCLIADCICVALLIVACVIGKFLKVPKIKRKELSNEVELEKIDIANKDIDTVSIDLQTKMGDPIEMTTIEMPNSDELEKYNKDQMHRLDGEESDDDEKDPNAIIAEAAIPLDENYDGEDAIDTNVIQFGPHGSKTDDEDSDDAL